MTNLELLWSWLQPVYGNDGAAAVLGNVRAESAYNPMNLQNSYEKKLGYNDLTYTAAVDSGAYDRYAFAHDSAGYGLAQWTHWNRKQNLYDFIKERKTSIGLLQGQCDFMITEIRGYGLSDQLKSSDLTLRDKVALVLRKYEKPADQSEANVDRRTGYAREILQQMTAAAPTGSKYAELVSLLRKTADELEKLTT